MNLTPSAAAVALLLTLAGCGASTPDAAGPAATSAAQTTTAKPDAKPKPVAKPPAAKPKPAGPKIGVAVSDGKFEFTVTKVTKGVKKIGTNPYLTKKPQGQFVLLAVTVKNIGEEAQTLDDSSQKLFDAKGVKASSDSTAAIYLSKDGSSVFLNQINPGNTVKGTLVFDVALTYVPAVIELHDSPFSGGVKVALR